MLVFVLVMRGSSACGFWPVFLSFSATSVLFSVESTAGFLSINSDFNFQISIQKKSELKFVDFFFAFAPRLIFVYYKTKRKSEIGKFLHAII